MSIDVQPLEDRHWDAVRAIHAQGIATGRATFETEPPSWETWDADHLREGRLVARVDGRVVGWAALSPVSDRCCYAGVAELSIYVAEGQRRRGVGRALMDRLVEASENAGLWTLQAGVFRENAESLRLFAACGFRQVGIRERLGQRDGRWCDVVLLERRSDRVG